MEAVAPRDYLVYGMYRLAASYPRETLTGPQRQALDNCLAAGEELAPPEMYDVSPWYNPYPEHDPMVAATHETMGPEQGPAPVTMAVWKLRFQTGARMTSNNLPTEKLESLVAKMDTFVGSVSGSR